MHVLEQVSGPLLADGPRPGLVRMLCGPAGAGKTTYAQTLEGQGFARLSVDEEIWRTSGRYGLDYQPTDYGRHQQAAEEALREDLARLMRRRASVVIDLSFWQRTARDRYRALIAEHGCEWELAYLEVDDATLRERLGQRSERFDANAAFAVSEDMLARFLAGFEVPNGEGEAVMRWR